VADWTPWTTGDIRRARQLALDGRTIAEIADALGRTCGATKRAMADYTEGWQILSNRGATRRLRAAMDGRTLGEVCASAGCSVDRGRRLLRAAGVDTEAYGRSNHKRRARDKTRARDLRWVSRWLDGESYVEIARSVGEDHRNVWRQIKAWQRRNGPVQRVEPEAAK